MAMLRPVLRLGLVSTVSSRRLAPLRLAGTSMLFTGGLCTATAALEAAPRELPQQQPAMLYASGAAILPAATSAWARLARIVRLLFHCGRLVLVGVPLAVTYPMARLIDRELPDWWWRLALWCGGQSSPAIIKFLQWASTRRDLFSIRFCDTFMTFHSHVQTHEWAFTEAMLADAFGPRWADEIDLERTPIGSGVIAQVYRGTRRSTGEPIAVKVVHPHIQERVALDLELLWLGARCIDAVLPNLSARVGMVTFAQVMASQVDLRLEAHNLAAFRRHFATRAGVAFPEPDLRWTTANVLVESFVEGRPIQDHIAALESFDRPLATVTIDAFLRMLFLDNFAHGDIHPGNILVTGGGIALLDAGIVNVLEPGDYDDFVELFHSIVNKDGYLAGEILLEKSPRHRCTDKHAFCTGIAALVARATTNLSLKDVPVGDLLTEVLELCGAHNVALQGRFVSVVVSIGVLEGVGRLLDPELDLLKIALPILVQAKLQRVKTLAFA
ncbi:glycoside hydrolase [Achlya hypogyna]|uniref:Glycoside hydrolase n=1 Tax=Achlya hypogyna TaxID=1202772 RepID=A0A1V9YL90_ACHHY|nr:glycoside hydrolase [Achlya hypogyna]